MLNAINIYHFGNLIKIINGHGAGSIKKFSTGCKAHTGYYKRDNISKM